MFSKFVSDLSQKFQELRQKGPEYSSTKFPNLYISRENTFNQKSIFTDRQWKLLAHSVWVPVLWMSVQKYSVSLKEMLTEPVLKKNWIANNNRLVMFGNLFCPQVYRRLRWFAHITRAPDFMRETSQSTEWHTHRAQGTAHAGHAYNSGVRFQAENSESILSSLSSQLLKQFFPLNWATIHFLHYYQVFHSPFHSTGLSFNTK